jgi:hypothetical protein
MGRHLITRPAPPQDHTNIEYQNSYSKSDATYILDTRVSLAQGTRPSEGANSVINTVIFTVVTFLVSLILTWLLFFFIDD